MIPRALMPALTARITSRLGLTPRHGPAASTSVRNAGTPRQQSHFAAPADGRHTMPPSTNEDSRLPVFTKTVREAMREMFPEEWADKSWDNVGMLVDNLKMAREEEEKPVVMLTNDLTPAVAAEATAKGASVIVSYHPIIFRPLKALHVSDWQQRLLLQLIHHNIAVYSPHTAIDAAADGLNDWLVDIVQGVDTGATDQLTSRSVIKPLASAASPPHTSGVGYGRRAHFANPVPLNTIIKRLAAGLGGLQHVLVARPRSTTTAASPAANADATVSSFAVCVGSGGDVLSDADDAELLVTGEMSHHGALRATMQGQTVVAVLHSNSERAFLRQRLQPMLLRRLRESGTRPHTEKAQVLVSEADHEPFEIVAVDALSQ